MTAAVQLFEGEELKTGLQLVSFGDLVGFSLLVYFTISLFHSSAFRCLREPPLLKLTKFQNEVVVSNNLVNEINKISK